MAPPIDSKQEELLKDIYYNKKIMYGRTRLFEYIKTNHPDSGISRRQLWDWLSNQKVHQVFQAKKKQTSTRPILSNAVGNVIQIDLIDFTNIPYKGFNYILNVIDVLSRKVFLVALKQKTVESVEKAIDVLHKEGLKFKIVQSDQGNEFKIDFSKYNAKHIVGQAYTPQQQSVIERSNGTIKTLIKKQLYISQNNNWIDILDDIENAYNNTINSTTKKTPNELYNSSSEQQKEVADNIKKEKSKGYTDTSITFNIGDRVRVLIMKKKSSKLQQNYTEEVFIINKIIKPQKDSNSVVRYQLTDEKKNIVKGYYNNSKLIKIDNVEDAPKQVPVKKQLKKLSRAETAGINKDNIIKGKRRR